MPDNMLISATTELVPIGQVAREFPAIKDLQGGLPIRYAQRYTVPVPHGKTVCQILSNETLAAATSAYLTLLRTDVEGVAFWPINSPTPAVEANTHEFGALLDLDAPDYHHSHGNNGLALSQGPHINSDAPAMPSTFPSWVNYLGDENWPQAQYAKRYYRTVVTPPTTRRPFLGKGLWNRARTDLSGGGDQHQSAALYYLGLHSYWNLGTAYDSLELHAGIDAGTIDATHHLHPLLCFYCYPYTDGYRDPTMFTVNGLGDTVWAPGDRNLCLAAQEATYGLGDWFELAGARASARLISHALDVAPPSNVQTSSGAALTSGYWAYRYPKKALWISFNAGAGNPVAGAPIWSRITAAMILHLGGIAEAINATQITNLWFGPQPGAYRWLNPHEAMTDQPWSTGSRPAIGLQNFTGRDAIVQLYYFGAA